MSSQNATDGRGLSSQKNASSIGLDQNSRKPNRKEHGIQESHQNNNKTWKPKEKKEKHPWKASKNERAEQSHTHDKNTPDKSLSHAEHRVKPTQKNKATNKA